MLPDASRLPAPSPGGDTVARHPVTAVAEPAALSTFGRRRP